MLTPNEKLCAISWKCRHLGLTYGQLVSQSPADGLEAIYDEYERLLNRRREARALRLSQRAGRQPARSPEEEASIDRS